jgi:pentatricopeptide repeat protein
MPRSNNKLQEEWKGRKLSLTPLLFALLFVILPATSFVNPHKRRIRAYSASSGSISVHYSRNGWRKQQQQQQEEEPGNNANNNNNNNNSQNKKRWSGKQNINNYSRQPQQQQQQQQAPNIEFNRWLSQYLKSDRGSAQEAERLLLERVHDHNRTNDYDVISYNLVLSAWSRRRSMPAARRADALLTILLQQPGLQADTYSYSAVLHAYAKSGGQRTAALRAEALLHQMECSLGDSKIQTEICHNAVMDCWSVSGNPDAGRRAQLWLTHLEERGQPPPTRISYNACLKAWARSPGGAQQAHSILKRMKKLGGAIAPDKISYSTCIDAYCKSGTSAGAAQQAETLLREMELASSNAALRPDVVAYSSVMYAYAKAGMVAEAMTLIDRMQEHAQQKPNTIFLNTLLHVFAKAGKVDAAEALLGSMRSSDMADKITYTAVIDAHASQGNVTRALQLLDELEDLYTTTQEEQYLPSAKTFASTMNAMAKATSKNNYIQPLATVDNLLRRMDRLYQVSGQPETLPNAVLYSQVFSVLSKSHDPNAATRATEYLEQMKQKGLRPDTATYAHLIISLSKSRIRNAADLATHYLQMVEEGFAAGDDSLKPTQLLYTAVLQAYAKSASSKGAKRAELLLQRNKELYKKGKLYAKPTALYYNAVMDALARSGGGRQAALQAETYLQELETRHRAGDVELIPKTRSYNAVILAWMHSNATDAPQRAEALLKRMNERYKAGDEDCRTDRWTINHIISVWAKSDQDNASERAETFLIFMEKLYEAGDSSLKPDSVTFNSVITAYSQSSSNGAAHRADELYERMKQLYEAGDKDLRPDICTLKSLHKAWSRSNGTEAPEKIKQISRLISHRQRRDSQMLRPADEFTPIKQSRCRTED